MEFRTFRQAFIDIPCQIVRTGPAGPLAGTGLQPVATGVLPPGRQALTHASTRRITHPAPPDPNPGAPENWAVAGRHATNSADTARRTPHQPRELDRRASSADQAARNIREQPRSKLDAMITA